MKTGSLIIGYQMPDISPHVKVTKEEATKLLIERLNKHMKVFNIEPSRYTWLERNNIPDDETKLPEFIHDCIQETGIDPSNVTVTQAGDPICCLWDTVLSYYYSFGLEWSQSGTKSPFTVEVPLTQTYTMHVPLGCTVIAHHYSLTSSVSPVSFPALRPSARR